MGIYRHTLSFVICLLALPVAASGVCERSSRVVKLLEYKFRKPCQEISTEDLSQIQQLSVLDFGDGAPLRAEDFQGMTSLEILRIAENGLTTLPVGIFRPLTALKELDLACNDFKTLPRNLFRSLNRLEILDLMCNEMTGLPEDIFHGLSSLRALYLNQNNFETLPENLFQKLPSLEVILLHFNHLVALKVGTFQGLRMLSRLSLGFNKLEVLPPMLFDSLDPSRLEMEGLYLYGNKLDQPTKIRLKKQFGSKVEL